MWYLGNEAILVYISRNDVLSIYGCKDSSHLRIVKVDGRIVHPTSGTHAVCLSELRMIRDTLRK